MGSIWKAGSLGPACALIWAATCASPTGAAPTTPQEQQVVSLVAQITKTINGLPNTTQSRQYEAQLAFVLDQSRLPCKVLLDAIAAAKSGGVFSPAAKAALTNLAAAMAGCRIGTGAGRTTADSGYGYGQVPNFSVGGGSDYTQ